MTRILSYLEALSEGLRQELEADPTVVVFGEDNIGGTGCDGTLGNAWGPTKGLHEKYPAQVLDAPITEAAFVGAAVGAAPHAPTPFSPVLEDAYAPSAAQIATAVLATQSTARETEPAS